MSDKVKVAVRVRPLVSYEIESGAEIVVNTEKEKRVRVAVPARNNTFEFDWAFNYNVPQTRIYNETCQPLIESFFNGYNATVFAYGQTGSGKTYTMGNDGKESKEGIIPFTINDIFQRCDQLNNDGIITKLTMSYLEIYKEECYDLLSSNRIKCDIREGTKGDTYVEGLSQHEINNCDDVFKILFDVSKMRSTAKTAMNSQSSRSHAICTFNLKTIKTLTEDGISTTITTTSSFNLVDLAGSERVKKTLASGDVFNEGVNINKGLLALGNVIVALSNGGNNVHVPYRDSKITRILKDSLGGNSLTIMIACISPADTNFEETLNTLRFASRVSCIVNNISLNKEYSGGLMDDNMSSTGNQQLLQEICHLREQLQLLQNKSASDSLVIINKNSNRQNNTLINNKDNVSIESVISLLSFLKKILIKCLEDDVMIENEIFEGVQNIISNLKKKIFSNNEGGINDINGINNINIGDEMIEFNVDFLPPIMKFIETLEEFEKNYNSTYNNNNNININNINRKSYESDNSQNNKLEEIEWKEEDDERIEEDEDIINENMQLMSSREKEVEDMMKLAEECKETISRLRQEVKTLEQEKQKVENKSNNDKNNGKMSNSDAEVLREKIRLLELKQKELRKKEVEYAKLLTQKEKACQEVTRLKNELNLNKQLRVEAQKKARQEAEKYAEERKKLMHADSQLRRREQIAQEKVAKITQELTNKDRVMKSQLEEKDREIKRLKTLGEKTEKVKNSRETILMPNRRPNTTDNSNFNTNNTTTTTSSSTTTTSTLGFHSKKALQQKNDQLSAEQIVQLQGWITREIDDQAWRNTLTEDIRIQNEERATCNKRLAYLRQQREKESNPTSTIASRTEEEIQRENEIKQLEEEMRSYAIDIAKLNGQLADLGVVVEKRRFSNITNLKEAKFLMQTMFQRLSVDVCAERRAYENRITAQEEELKALRAALSHYESVHGLNSNNFSNHNIIVNNNNNNNNNNNSSIEIKKKSKIPTVELSINQNNNNSNNNNNEVVSRKLISKNSQDQINHSHSSTHTNNNTTNNSNNNNSTHNLSALMRPTTSSALHAKPKIKDTKIQKPILASRVLTNLKLNNDQRNTQSQIKDNNYNENENENDNINEKDDNFDTEDEQDSNDEIDDNESESSNELDETFCSDDVSDFSEDEDEEEVIEHIRKVNKKDSNNQPSKKRSSKEFESSDDYSESSGSQSKNKKLKLKQIIDTDFINNKENELDIPLLPLEKYKVPELKKFLSDRSLTVGGKKADLIERLTKYMNATGESSQNIILDSPIDSKIDSKIESKVIIINDENINQINQQSNNSIPNTPHGGKRKLGRTNYLPLVSES